MREIKFRAWDKRDGGMSNVFSLDDLYQAGLMGLRLEHKEEDYIIMQYTGLKDKNGKEIYEEDIVKHEHEPGLAVVKFGKGYQGEPADGMYPYWGWHTEGWHEKFAFGNDELEIVGNVYENPELLKEKDK